MTPATGRLSISFCGSSCSEVQASDAEYEHAAGAAGGVQDAAMGGSMISTSSLTMLAGVYGLKAGSALVRPMIQIGATSQPNIAPASTSRKAGPASCNASAE